MLLEKIREFKTRLETKKMYEDLNNAIELKRRQNMEIALHVLTNYLIVDQLERTGILYRPEDKYIQTKVQQLFWEWKHEGIIDEYEDFTDETKSWIFAYL